jgi:hypothetical protein
MAKVKNIWEDTLFSIPTTCKEIWYYNVYDTSDTNTWSWVYTEILASGFGVIFRGRGELGYDLYLRGAVINGLLYGDTTLVAVQELGRGIFPTQVTLFQNYPNPYNPTTKINFELSKRTHVRLKIFDVLGREVRSLIDTTQSAGKYSLDFNAHELPSGIYFYRLETAEIIQTKKMILQK